MSQLIYVWHYLYIFLFLQTTDSFKLRILISILIHNSFISKNLYRFIFVLKFVVVVILLICYHVLVLIGVGVFCLFVIMFQCYFCGGLIRFVCVCY